jgi:hypothetical protein
MTDVESVYCAVGSESCVKQTTFRLHTVDDDTLVGVVGHVMYHERGYRVIHMIRDFETGRA